MAAVYQYIAGLPNEPLTECVAILTTIQTLRQRSLFTESIEVKKMAGVIYRKVMEYHGGEGNLEPGYE